MENKEKQQKPIFCPFLMVTIFSPFNMYLVSGFKYFRSGLVYDFNVWQRVELNVVRSGHYARASNRHGNVLFF